MNTLTTSPITQRLYHTSQPIKYYIKVSRVGGDDHMLYNSNSSGRGKVNGNYDHHDKQRSSYSYVDGHEDDGVHDDNTKNDNISVDADNNNNDVKDDKHRNSNNRDSSGTTAFVTSLPCTTTTSTPTTTTTTTSDIVRNGIVSDISDYLFKTIYYDFIICIYTISDSSDEIVRQNNIIGSKISGSSRSSIDNIREYKINTTMDSLKYLSKQLSHEYPSLLIPQLHMKTNYHYYHHRHHHHHHHHHGYNYKLLIIQNWLQYISNIAILQQSSVLIKFLCGRNYTSLDSVFQQQSSSSSKQSMNRDDYDNDVDCNHYKQDARRGLVDDILIYSLFS
jgi:hypothetical protein